MNTPAFVWKSLWRNRVRTGLTIASVAVSVFLFTLLLAVVASMQRVAADAAEQLRLVVHHKTSITKLLPLRIGREIAAMPGVRAVCPVRWFGGRLKDNPEQFPSLAGEPAAVPVVYSDFELRPDEIDAWLHTRTAAIVGSELAQRMAWQRGQRVTLHSTVPPYLTLEFRVVGITYARAYPNIFALRLDYLRDALRQRPGSTPEYVDAAYFFWVKADSRAALEHLPAEIDARFAHSPHATRSEHEEAFVAQFTRMFGDIPQIAAAVGAIVIPSLLLVVLNTMAMTIRERTGELAVLKAMGFGGLRRLLLTGAEAGLLGLLGATLGCAAAALLLSRVATAGLNIPYFPVLTLSPTVLAAAAGIGVLMGLLAGVAPGWRAARISVATALRTVR